MKKVIKRIGILLTSILLLSIIALVVASFYFYNVAIKRSEKRLLQNNDDLSGQYGKGNQDLNSKEQGIEGPEWVENQSYETWSITSGDGLKLIGYYIPARKDTDRTVILAHGYTSRGKDMGTFAKFYHEQFGFNVLMPDARGHGESEGDYIGFGWPERKDYLLWIDKVVDRVGNDSQIVLHGISMGAATVMMVSGEDLPKQVKAVIEDCGYTSVYDELAYQLKRMYNLPEFPVLAATSILTDIRAGYSFYEASALKQVERNRLPMLFIHGGNDTFVPTEMVFRLYNACGAEKDILVVEGAGHGLAYTVGRYAYQMKIKKFLKYYLD